MSNIKRETSTTVSDLHDLYLSDSIKRLAISHDGHPQYSHHMEYNQQQASAYVSNINAIDSGGNTPFSMSREPTPVNENSKPPMQTFPGIKNPIELTNNPTPILTVLSKARDGFESKYNIIREIGKGGFSTVYLCDDRRTGIQYAVKVIDLRPLRLRERFNPARLKREVDIMKRLHHPNIIQFVEVFEDVDHLLMVMEYCPGKELFDVILERKYFSEKDAKPVFAQIAQALYYLHSLNIIHRDIKPENILISNNMGNGGTMIAKLLDFGLSKNAGNGSAAKTFVGTPCYLAPEVEYTSRGLGGTYGLPADCWSLGAVLYVMLVARFPEFEQDFSGKVVVKLPPGLWNGISAHAKDLIRSLMNTNPAARMTAANALQHPWLDNYRASTKELSNIALSVYDLSQGLQAEEEKFVKIEKKMKNADGKLTYSNSVEMNASGVVVHNPTAMVLRNNADHNNNAVVEQLQLAPLLHLQRSIAGCFDEVHASYQELPEVAAQIRRGAALCRDQLTESTKMLRTIDQTATSVLAMFNDLELAVEEGEPKLAAELFGMVKGWVISLRESVSATQIVNRASMEQIQQIVEQSTLGIISSNSKKKPTNSNGVIMPKRLLDALFSKLNLTEMPMIENGNNDEVLINSNDDDNIELNADQVLELFMSLFGQTHNNQRGMNYNSNNNLSTSAVVLEHKDSESIYSIDSDTSYYVDSNNNLNHNNSINSNNNDDNVNMVIDNNNESNTNNSSPTRPINNSRQTNNKRTSPVDISNMNSTSTVSLPHTNSNSSKLTPNNNNTNINTNNNTKTPSSPVIHSFGSYDIDMTGVTNDNNSGKSKNIIKPINNNQPSIPSRVVPVPLLLTNNITVPTTNSSGKGNNTTAQDLTVPGSPSTAATAKLAEALDKLRQVDKILEELSVFWANTEVVLDLLTKKGQHVEQFIGFSQKPKLMARFKERMEEYKRFWERVSILCTNYISGVKAQQLNPETKQRMYGFLDKSVQQSTYPNSSNHTNTSYLETMKEDSFEDLFNANKPANYH
eukprot:gene8663-11706_t